MKIIIVQGNSCLGKTTLCKNIVGILPKSVVLSLDDFKEDIWDKFGFSSVEEKEKLSLVALGQCLERMRRLVKENNCDYILIEYPFKDSKFEYLLNTLLDIKVNYKMIYLQTNDTEEHLRTYINRIVEVGKRHPGHNASYYENGIGKYYKEVKVEDISFYYPYIKDTLFIEVRFNPYLLDKSIEEIIAYIKAD